MRSGVFSRLLPGVCALVLSAGWCFGQAGLPVREVVLDVYDPATGSVRQAVRYVSPTGAVPGLRDAALHPGAGGLPRGLRLPAGRQRVAVDLPGRSPADVLRLATGGEPQKVAGTWRALCLLVDFADHPPQWYGGAAGPAHFAELLFSRGAVDGLRDYYWQVSYNQFDLTGDVSGGPARWYRAPENYAYYTYGASGLGAYPHNAQKLVEQVVDLADPRVNYANYDNDGDGYVDALLVVHSGPGAGSLPEADQPNHLWAHKGTITDRRRDGKTISVYTIQAEDRLAGTFAHEFGHVLGLPDLYDTDYSSNGVGRWSLMASGDKLGNPLGSTPAHLDPWSKKRLGWLTPTIVRGSLEGAALPDVEAHARAYCLWQGGAPGAEYFLVENRQQHGFDSLLPGAGLCIWHIDEGRHKLGNTQEWWPGRPDEQHYLVALEQADGRWDLEHGANEGDSGDPFPGNSGKRAFTPSSTPSSDSYREGPSTCKVWNISNADAGLSITADLRVVRSDLVAPTSVVVAPAAPHDVDNLTATAAGGSDPDGGAITYQYTWWVSSDGGQTFARDLAANGRTLAAASTKPWQMWKSLARTRLETEWSAWTASAPVTICPDTDEDGDPVGRLWYVHYHNKPAGWTTEQWNLHLAAQDGRSWGTSFHELQGAADAAGDSDLILIRPGSYASPDDHPFRSVTLRSTNPEDRATRAATTVSGAMAAGTHLKLLGVTGSVKANGEVTLRRCGNSTVTSANSLDLTVRTHEGTLGVTAWGAAARVSILDNGGLKQLTLNATTSGECSLVVTGNTLCRPVTIVGQSSSAVANVTFSRNTLTGADSLLRSSGVLMVTANTATESALRCWALGDSFTGAQIARNRLSKSRKYGLMCESLAPATVSDNRITACTGPGVVFSRSPEITSTARVFSNTISGNKGGGVWVEGFGLPLRIHHNTITNNEHADGEGGGIYAWADELEIDHNTISGNSAVTGGGICYRSVGEDCVPAPGRRAATRDHRPDTVLIHDNDLNGNRATALAGGVFLGGEFEYAHPICEFNTITGNQAPRGGGVSLLEGVVRRNVIRGNTAANLGGGVFKPWMFYDLTSEVENNVIYGNTADGGGGVAVSNLPGINGTSARLTNNTIDANQAARGGGIFVTSSGAGLLQIYNCLVTGNLGGGGVRAGVGTVDVSVRYCNVFGNTGGNYVNLVDETGDWGNLSLPARYADAAGGDYHLQSVAGRWNASTGAWVQDSLYSPCIDAGDPTDAYAAEPLPNGGRVNMGAYGNTEEASKFQSMLVSHTPATGAADVSRAAAVVLNFRWKVFRTSAQSRFALTPQGAAPVGGAFTWSADNKRLTFVPTLALGVDKQYTVSLGAGIERQDGVTITWPESFTFRTGDSSTVALAFSAAAAAGGDGASVTVRLSRAATVEVAVCNLAGREVARLAPRQLPAGVSSLAWNGRSGAGTRVPPGQYLLQLRACGADGAQARALVPWRR